MDNPILFSIIVPTYNRAHIVSATIESILAQTYTNFELLIIDDGSTDNTEEVLKKYLSEKVFYYKKTNGERAAARNYGTQKARGEYINWFDSDDLMYPDNLSAAFDLIQKYDNPEVFVQGFDVCDQSMRIIELSNFPDNVNNELYKGNLWGNSPVIVRKDIALANPFNQDRELSASEDYELWLRLAARYKLYTSPVRTLAYIFHAENSTITMRDPQQLIKRYTKFLQYTTADKQVIVLLGKHKNYFLMKNYLLLSVDLTINKYKWQGLKYLLKSISYSPLVFFEKGFGAFIKYFLNPF